MSAVLTMLAYCLIRKPVCKAKGIRVTKKEHTERGYKGAFILLYTFLAMLMAVWFAVYAVLVSRGPVG